MACDWDWPQSTRTMTLEPRRGSGATGPPLMMTRTLPPTRVGRGMLSAFASTLMDSFLPAGSPPSPPSLQGRPPPSRRHATAASVSKSSFQPSSSPKIPRPSRSRQSGSGPRPSGSGPKGTPPFAPQVVSPPFPLVGQAAARPLAAACPRSRPFLSAACPSSSKGPSLLPAPGSPPPRRRSPPPPPQLALAAAYPRYQPLRLSARR